MLYYATFTLHFSHTYIFIFNSSYALHRATIKGDLKTITYLIINNHPIHDPRQPFNRTPLHTASEHNQIDSLKLILHLVKSVQKLPILFLLNERLSFNHFTPLHIAAQEGHTEMVVTLASFGADIGLFDKQSNLPFHLALQHGHFHTASVLYQLHPLIHPLNNGFVKVEGLNHPLAPILGMTMKERDNSKWVILGKTGSAMSFAVKYGHFDLIRFLCSLGESMEGFVEQYGDLTFLQYAVRERMERMVIELIRFGADVNAKRKEGESVLHMAVSDYKIAKIILKHGANVNVEDVRGWTPLHAACKIGNVKMVKRMVEAGASLEAKGREIDGHVRFLFSPLQVAVMHMHVSVIDYLIIASAKHTEIHGPPQGNHFNINISISLLIVVQAYCTWPFIIR